MVGCSVVWTAFFMPYCICNYRLLTGVMAACVQKRLSSEIGFKGIAKKVTIFLLVAVANMIDVNIIKTGNAARTAVVFFISQMRVYQYLKTLR